MAHRRIFILQFTFVALALVYTAQLVTLTTALNDFEASVTRHRSEFSQSQELTNRQAIMAVQRRQLHAAAPAETDEAAVEPAKTPYQRTPRFLNKTNTQTRTVKTSDVK